MTPALSVTLLPPVVMRVLSSREMIGGEPVRPPDSPFRPRSSTELAQVVQSDD